MRSIQVSSLYIFPCLLHRSGPLTIVGARMSLLLVLPVVFATLAFSIDIVLLAYDRHDEIEIYKDSNIQLIKAWLFLETRVGSV